MHPRHAFDQGKRLAVGKIDGHGRTHGDQAQGADTDAQQADATAGDVNGVLNGMFNLFESTPPARPAVTAKAPSAAASQKALVLPKANVQTDMRAQKKRRFLDQIFNSQADAQQSSDTKPKKKKKKKKTLFDSIF